LEFDEATLVTLLFLLGSDQRLAVSHIVNPATTGIVLVTGPGGTGKSQVIDCIRCYFRNVTETYIKVLALTGKAAINIDGQTIESFLHSNSKPAIVIVDEISMVSKQMLSHIFQKICRCAVLIVLLGDFWQLPPILTNKDLLDPRSPQYETAKRIAKVTFKGRDPVDGGLFAFEHPRLAEAPHFELKQQFRQSATDQQFASVLTDLRDGKGAFRNVTTFLQQRQSAYDQTDPLTLRLLPHLFSTNREVKEHNVKMEELLPPNSPCVEYEPNLTWAIRVDRTGNQSPWQDACLKDFLQPLRTILADFLSEYGPSPFWDHHESFYETGTYKEVCNNFEKLMDNKFGSSSIPVMFKHVARCLLLSKTRKTVILNLSETLLFELGTKKTKLLDIHQKTLAPLQGIVIKQGMRVMVTANIRHLNVVNGSTGIVDTVYKDTSSRCLIILDDGRHVDIGPYTSGFTTVTTDLVKSQQTINLVPMVRYLPLIPAWAMTLHKMQGATLLRAVVNLGTCQSLGMLYLALSRFKTPNGILLASANIGRRCRLVDYAVRRWATCTSTYILVAEVCIVCKKFFHQTVGPPYRDKSCYSCRRDSTY
jgi:hypothetical protein